MPNPNKDIWVATKLPQTKELIKKKSSYLQPKLVVDWFLIEFQPFACIPMRLKKITRAILLIGLLYCEFSATHIPGSRSCFLIK